MEVSLVGSNQQERFRDFQQLYFFNTLFLKGHFFSNGNISQ